ncbi:hypothetical protein DENSPDRAFT_805374 [Dentipellis sp. KUC8613]|nr:hypothetical protein DENSPDRAFT_805374 [Dentipellis sp. KUC8613]
MVSDKLASHVGFSSTHRVLNAVQRQICVESAGAFVGPMDPRKFLEAFVPPPPPKNGKERTIPNVSFEEMTKTDDEIEMYPIYVEICKKLDQDKIMAFRDTHASSDPSTVPPGAPERLGLRPDVMTYLRDRPPRRTTDFARAERADEFKFKYGNFADPFDDEPNGSSFPFEGCTEGSKDVRGQITSYAAAMLDLQFRTFVFSVLIMGEHARLIRWDRSGAIVTRSFDYCEDPEPLAQFLWRFNFLSPAQRGHDESVEVVGDKEDSMELFQAQLALKKHVAWAGAEKLDLFRLRMTPLNSDTTPLPVKPSVPPAESYHSFKSMCKPSRLDGWDYYVIAPTMSERGPFGRATRSLYVYDRDAEVVRHLKDTNRIISHKHTVEHKIIKELGDKKVPHITTMHAAWDVAPKGECYNTLTPTFYNDKEFETWFAPPKENHQKGRRTYRSYRLITNELGTVVWKFKDWKEVVQTVVDVLEALDGAERAGWRHRDVSVGNMMILNGRGLLIDWDASQKPEDMNCENEARLPDLTGTWQFMSTSRLLDVNARHDAVDDIESVFWVLLWLTLNYSRHPLSPRKLRNYLQQVFDSYVLDDDGFATGGGPKQALLRSDELSDYFHFSPQPPCLGEVLSHLHHQVGLRYYPPKKPYVASKSPEVRRLQQKHYEEELKIYEAEKASSEDAMFIHSLLMPVLEEQAWPTYGPESHPLPPVHDGPQIRERSKNRSSFFRAQEIARYGNNKPTKAPSLGMARVKIRRTGESLNARALVTSYAPLQERDEGGGGHDDDDDEEEDGGGSDDGDEEEREQAFNI